ncbi:unnamed protein product [Bacillus thuringiensis DB27]|uniref:Uncharacterized protein n=1 Tax=Bacillus thuringiensis DB27 TaxID=1431339 RepID=W8YXG5_BACTU|nr:unnamed protein product [Bacillus thuringiensis DB27]
MLTWAKKYDILEVDSWKVFPTYTRVKRYSSAATLL